MPEQCVSVRLGGADVSLGSRDGPPAASRRGRAVVFWCHGNRHVSGRQLAQYEGARTRAGNDVTCCRTMVASKVRIVRSDGHEGDRRDQPPLWNEAHVRRPYEHREVSAGPYGRPDEIRRRHWLTRISRRLKRICPG